MKISEIITDKYKLRIPPTVYYELLADVVEAEEEQEPCNTDTCKVVKAYMNEWDKPITAEPKTGHCKDCKYFEYDSVAKVDGIPLIVAHEICSRWGDGCKTKEDGYCFLFEPQERSNEE